VLKKFAAETAVSTVIPMADKEVAPPAGEKNARPDPLNVPDRPIIPFFRSDGTGPEGHFRST
jgi:hypothetical protein